MKVQDDRGEDEDTTVSRCLIREEVTRGGRSADSRHLPPEDSIIASP